MTCYGQAVNIMGFQAEGHEFGFVHLASKSKEIKSMKCNSNWLSREKNVNVVRTNIEHEKD